MPVLDPRPRDRRDQQRVAEQELVVGGVDRRVVRILEQQRAQDRRAGAMRLLEGAVQIRQQLHPQRSMSRQTVSHGSPNAHGSCGDVPSRSGCGRTAGRSRTRSSAPAARRRSRRRSRRRRRRTSCTPESPRFCSCGMLIHRCSHHDELSPVQCRACRCSPAKPARVITNGRRSGRRRRKPFGGRAAPSGSRRGCGSRRAGAAGVTGVDDVVGHRRLLPGRTSPARPCRTRRPRRPTSRIARCWSPHHSRVAAFVKSGNAHSPGQTTLRYSSPSLRQAVERPRRSCRRSSPRRPSRPGR